MVKKKRGKRKRQRPSSKSHRELLSKLEEQSIIKRQETSDPPDSNEAMSEVIMEFIKPFMEYADTYKRVRILLIFACLAWNASMLPDDRAEAELEEMLNDPSFSELHGEGVRELLEGLIERRREHFAHHTRPIADYKLTDTEDGITLSITPFPDFEKDILGKGFENEK
ncbi:hypothetical protein ACFL6S_11310 [Candidatus Poribacteria bacterium]